MADNDGLIQKELDLLQHIGPYPNMTLDPELDLVEERYATRWQYKISASFNHVKGHQDSSTPSKSLSLPAKLNVEADNLASSIYYEGPLWTQKILMTPLCRAKLSIQGINVTNNCTKHILQAYTENNYIQYLQDHYHWNPYVTLKSFLGHDYNGDYASFREIV